jgi:hypothetical protein
MTDQPTPKRRGLPFSDPRHPMHRPSVHRPPRAYQPRNVAAVVHGASSDRIVDELAARYRERALDLLGGTMPGYLAERPEWDAAILAWSRAEARAWLLARYLDDVGLLDQDGNPRPAVATAMQAEQVAAKARDALGLNPVAAAKLGQSLASGAVDIARLWAVEAKADQS